MRTALAAVFILGVASGASAQSSESAHSAKARSNPDGPILSIGLPLPRIGLPLPPTGLRPPIDDKARRGQHRRDGDRGGRRPGKGDRHRHHPVPVAVVPYFWPYPVLETVAYPLEPAPAPADTPPTGMLYLDLHPASVQLFVDGYYVGTTDDLLNGAIRLEAVPHRLEFRAPGYETLVLDVNVPADRETTYRGGLKPTHAAAAPGDPSSAPTDTTSRSPVPFYVIPGCYVGNVPPKDARLPDTCDESRAVILPH